MIRSSGRFRHGLVIGKFYPPHLGHHQLISRAAAAADRVTVLVMTSQVESLSLATRVSWLSRVHRERGEDNVTVIGVPCDVPMDLGSDPVWAAHVAIMRAAVSARCDVPVDAVFSSEAYGDELASRLSAEHVLVDPAREALPVSGTSVRGDLAAFWDRLDPVVRAGLTTRVVVVGAESTGTTTVSRALAEHYRARGGVWARTRWVPEYGRDYTVTKLERARRDASAARRRSPDMDELAWDARDFAEIARTQDALEDAAARAGSPLLVCDTDSFATSVWEYRYVGPGSHSADRAAASRPLERRLYVLTDHEGVPFVQDGWRDGEHVRAAMTDWFVDRLTRAGRSWVLLTGSLEERVDLAATVTEAALMHNGEFAEPLGHIGARLAGGGLGGAGR